MTTAKGDVRLDNNGLFTSLMIPHCRTLNGKFNCKRRPETRTDERDLVSQPLNIDFSTTERHESILVTSG